MFSFGNFSNKGRVQLFWTHFLPFLPNQVHAEVQSTPQNPKPYTGARSHQKAEFDNRTGVFWDGIYETADGDSFADRTLLKYEDDDKDNLADKRGQIWGVLFCTSPTMF